MINSYVSFFYNIMKYLQLRTFLCWFSRFNPFSYLHSHSQAYIIQYMIELCNEILKVFLIYLFFWKIKYHNKIIHSSHILKSKFTNSVSSNWLEINLIFYNYYIILYLIFLLFFSIFILIIHKYIHWINKTY